MLVARVVSGIGMGFVNSTVPVIQAEFSPKSARGRFVCMQLSTLNFGKCIRMTETTPNLQKIAELCGRHCDQAVLSCNFLALSQSCTDGSS
jgi:hypothetical protein